MVNVLRVIWMQKYNGNNVMLIVNTDIIKQIQLKCVGACFYFFC